MAVEVAEVWETVKQAIVAYTGLSPAAFFTVMAVLLALYYAVSGFFEAPPAPARKLEEEGLEKVEPLPPPVQLGEITEEELRQYDGSDTKKPLLMAIKGQIYDVTQSRVFYGPGGPYALFAGKDASRALAKMSFEPKDLNGDLTGLGPFELDALQDWEYRFISKYVKVGTVKRTVPVTEESAADSSQTTETAARGADVSSADSQVGDAVGSENGPLERGTEAEHNAEPKDHPVDHGDAAEHRPEVEDSSVNFSAESKEVGEGEGTKEF